MAKAKPKNLEPKNEQSVEEFLKEQAAKQALAELKRDPVISRLRKEVQRLQVELDDARSPGELLDRDRVVLRLKAAKGEAESRLKAAIGKIDALEEQSRLLTTLRSRPAVKGRSKPRRVRADAATAIIILSDWHIEEPVYPETVNGLNEFNLEIAEKRVRRTFDKALLLLEDARNLAPIDELVVGLLGDFISGYIHPELEEMNLLAPLPACRLASRLIEEGLRTLLAHGGVKQIVVPTCVGNHGRTTHKTRFTTSADNSYEHNMYLELAARFAGEPRIRWQVGEGYFNWVDVQGYPCRFSHGDYVKYSGGVGGISIATNKAIPKWNGATRAAYDFFGHHHEFLPYGGWYSNGSLIGYGALSLAFKGTYQPPQQTFAVLDRQRGVTRCLPIFCD